MKNPFIEQPVTLQEFKDALEVTMESLDAHRQACAEYRAELKEVKRNAIACVGHATAARSEFELENTNLRAEVERLTDGMSWREAKTEDENCRLRAELDAARDAFYEIKAHIEMGDDLDDDAFHWITAKCEKQLAAITRPPAAQEPKP